MYRLRFKGQYILHITSPWVADIRIYILYCSYIDRENRSDILHIVSLLCLRFSSNVFLDDLDFCVFHFFSKSIARTFFFPTFLKVQISNLTNLYYVFRCAAKRFVAAETHELESRNSGKYKANVYNINYGNTGTFMSIFHLLSRVIFAN